MESRQLSTNAPASNLRLTSFQGGDLSRMAQRAVALPLVGAFLIFWIAALCRAKGDDGGGGYLVLDDGFPISYLQQQLVAKGLAANSVTLGDKICLKLSAGLHSMVVEGLTLNWHPTDVYSEPRLRMPTTLRGDRLWGRSRTPVTFSHGFSGKRFLSLLEEGGDHDAIGPSSMEAVLVQPLLLCRKRVTPLSLRRCPPPPPPPGIPPPPPPPDVSPAESPQEAPIAPFFIETSPPPPRQFILAGPQHVTTLGTQ